MSPVWIQGCILGVEHPAAIEVSLMAAIPAWAPAWKGSGVGDVKEPCVPHSTQCRRPEGKRLLLLFQGE
jgi:hypothetical protein